MKKIVISLLISIMICAAPLYVLAGGDNIDENQGIVVEGRYVEITPQLIDEAKKQGLATADMIHALENTLHSAKGRAAHVHSWGPWRTITSVKRSNNQGGWCMVLDEVRAKYCYNCSAAQATEQVRYVPHDYYWMEQWGQCTVCGAFNFR